MYRINKLRNKCVSKTQCPLYTGRAVKTTCNTLAPFSRAGNISVAACMPLYSVLKTIKINGGVEFRRDHYLDDRLSSSHVSRRP